MHKNLRRIIYLVTILIVVVFSTVGCNYNNNPKINDNNQSTNIPGEEVENTFEGTVISLSDNGIQVDEHPAATDTNNAVYIGADIVYYEEGHDDTYGDGSKEDSHSADEAKKHTVITITQPGEYKVTGELSYGQIAIDLGEDAKENSEAVVTLILDDANINCTVAPAIVVYNAYESGSDDVETATYNVDTTNAGFRLVISDNSTNVVNGAYVAEIYKEGTTDKLHKYDAAIESKVSFNIDGETLDNGKLTVNATNEGIESGLHLTINGGEITINSSDDSINTNEDGVSVLTINGGIITCDSGNGNEGDGIDSNGYIVINGGYTIASANPKSKDSGIDSDLGIYINGGTLLATGNMYDKISSDSTQNFMVLGFKDLKSINDLILIKDSDGKPFTAFNSVNDYTIAVFSNPDLTDGEYTLYEVSSVTGDLNGSIYTNITDYKDAKQLQYTSIGMMGMGNGMMKPDSGEAPPDGQVPPDGKAPSGMQRPPDGNIPNGGARPENMERPDVNNGTGVASEPSTIFNLTKSSYTFSGISTSTENK